MAKLIAEFDADAGTNYVYPIDTRNESRNTTFPPYEQSRLFIERDFFRTAHSIPGLLLTPMVGDRSYVMRANFDWQAGDEGVIFALGDRFCGMTLFVEDSALHFVYQWWHSPKTVTPITLSSGAQVFEFSYHATGDRKGNADITLNGVQLFNKVDLSPSLLRIPSCGLSIGISRRTAVSERYEHKGAFEYTGNIDRLRITPGELAPASLEEPSEEIYQDRLRHS